MAEHHAPATPKDETQPFHLALLLVGGLCLGTGVLNLLDSFGWLGGDLNSNYGQVGWSALDNISLLPGASVAVPLVVVGALCLVIANATAWKQTGGY